AANPDCLGRQSRLGQVRKVLWKQRRTVAVGVVAFSGCSRYIHVSDNSRLPCLDLGFRPRGLGAFGASITGTAPAPPSWRALFKQPLNLPRILPRLRARAWAGLGGQRSRLGCSNRFGQNPEPTTVQPLAAQAYCAQYASPDHLSHLRRAALPSAG